MVPHARLAREPQQRDVVARQRRAHRGVELAQRDRVRRAVLDHVGEHARVDADALQDARVGVARRADIGAARTRASSAPSRATDPGETVSSATRAAAPDDAYQGSRSRRGYAESRITECSVDGWRAMNSCTKNVP